MTVRVSWSQAVTCAQRLQSGCEAVSPSRPLGDAAYRSTVERWALVVYAIAGETGEDPDAVPESEWASRLRYRLDDRDAFTEWLGGQLIAMGHPVKPLEMPERLRGGYADAQATDMHLAALYAESDPRSDDPVAARWRSDTIVTASSAETTDGVTVTFPYDCPLWQHRPVMIGRLDAALHVERGGWLPGTRVRTRGVPHWIGPDGRLPAEAGVSGDRAEVLSPVWELDHERHRLADGPPRAYRLRHRSLSTGRAAADAPGPVPASALVLDLDPFPDPTPVALPEPPATESTDPHVTDKHVTDKGDVVPVVDRDTEPKPLPHAGVASAAGTASGPTGSGVPGVPADVDPDRAAAINRLWQLRDRELSECGDSTPRRVAERLVAGAYLGVDEKPPTSRDLLQAEQARRNRPIPDLAPWCDPDRELVTGTARDELRNWLRAMRWCTLRQREVLDGLGPDSTLADVEDVLRQEGFLHVRTVPTWTPPDATGVLAAGPDGVDVVLVNPDTGWLATVHAPDSGSGPRVENVRVHLNAAELDHGLLIPGPAGQIMFDAQGRRTNIAFGRITAHPRRRSSGDEPSLRVQLAVLRAFTRPVMPWLRHPTVHLGRDGTPPVWRRNVLAALPAWVHDLLGPALITPESP
ncbi:hypothetical protein [Saccharothrix sp. ALI-22-I]|uniref:hypothetical protein n=1 Tax=Saccharothrix sp. ALI-22-I TaxID=1933778 RepID=UPI00117A0B08|nr:hypothetical protein [Saccharothrix sp. ALI-22-I]